MVIKTIEVANAIVEFEHLPAVLEEVALEVGWLRCLDQGISEGDRDVGGLGAGNRNVLGSQDLGSDNGKVADDILDRADDGVGAARVYGNLPLDVHNGVDARRALDDVVCKSLCLRLELVSIFGRVCPPMDAPDTWTHSQGKRGAHQDGDDEVDVLHAEGLLIETGEDVVVDWFSSVEEFKLSKRG